MNKRKKLETESATEQVIREVAFRLFLEKGYEATNLREIGAQSGINASSIYFYYQSKKELFLSILREAYQTRLDIIKRDLSNISANQQKNVMKEIFFCMISSFMQDCASYKLILRYKIFPITELYSEIIKLYEEYEEYEFLLMMPYIFSQLNDTEENKRVFFHKFKKVSNGLISEMLISGQAVTETELNRFWMRFEDCIFDQTL